MEKNMWKDKKVLVTGGASFIGSHLVDFLLKKGATVTVADDFSSGELKNLEYPLKKEGANKWKFDRLTVYQGDLKEKSFTSMMVKDMEVIFHLAALHGGRGYIYTHPAQCCTNMILDQLVFEEAYKAGIEKLCFASSACVYPPNLQNDPSYLLKEEDVDFSKDVLSADCEYGWAKLMGEIGIRAYHRQHGMKYCGARIFTAYGPRENETHAVIALIAKAFIKMDPYEIWGTGEQDRNFTYVEDIVEGLINVAEKVSDGSCINVGREDRITINELAELIFELVGWRPKKIIHDTSKPEGVASRAADLTKARKILNWEPKISIKEGLKRTIDWYYSTHSLEEVKKDFEKRLLER